MPSLAEDVTDKPLDVLAILKEHLIQGLITAVRARHCGQRTIALTKCGW